MVADCYDLRVTTAIRTLSRSLPSPRHELFGYHLIAGPFPSGRHTNLLATRLPACAAVARAAGCVQLSACNSIGIVRCARAADRLRIVRAAARLFAIVRARAVGLLRANRCACCACQFISFESFPSQLESFDVDILRINEARTDLSWHRVIALQKTRINSCGTSRDACEFR